MYRIWLARNEVELLKFFFLKYASIVSNHKQFPTTLKYTHSTNVIKFIHTKNKYIPSRLVNLTISIRKTSEISFYSLHSPFHNLVKSEIYLFSIRIWEKKKINLYKEIFSSSNWLSMASSHHIWLSKMKFFIYFVCFLHFFLHTSSSPYVYLILWMN